MMVSNFAKTFCLAFLVLLFRPETGRSQKSSIRETRMSMPTYMFSDPDPVPNPGRIYPYFRFDGFSTRSQMMEWNMVVLENDYIRVLVCPDIGGKVWAAVEKSTGGEFIYYNKVVKFRDVAMRGPWTSGGLEFNFGDIGHAPTCSTPVDYRISENEDGSVSCTVGATDLPSGTRWNVEIRLPAEAAFFETEVRWYNTTPMPTSYYHWMNAAARSAGNLEIIAPGTGYIGHGGEPGAWPVENGRNLAFYEKNNFGSYKSYHIVNGLAGFFGGYWHDDGFGFGHLASFDEKPGKKIWIWGLSRQGMIWEGLLTDTDGQYIEYQAGKLLNQAAEPSTFTPFKHREFAPHDADVMRELWIPLLGTGGMKAASEYAVLNAVREGEKVTLYLSALQPLRDKLVIDAGGKRLEHELVLRPLELNTTEFDLAGVVDFAVVIGDKKLVYHSNEADFALDRSVAPNTEFDWNSAYGLYTMGIELERQRLYKDAHEYYQRCLDLEPAFLPALSRMALSEYRRLNNAASLEHAGKAIAIDTYDPLANYVYGLVNTRLGHIAEAKSGFSLAAQSPSYRSAAYTELAVLALQERDFRAAVRYAGKALDFNTYNLTAIEIAILANRNLGQAAEYSSLLNMLEERDPNSHFARYERTVKGLIDRNAFLAGLRSELPDETLLELGLAYRRYGAAREAADLFSMARNSPIAMLWKASLQPESAQHDLEGALAASAEGVFPHRDETAILLESLLKQREHWKLNYYLGLIHWNKGNTDRARQYFLHCGDLPDFAAFYLARARLFRAEPDVVKNSLERARGLAPGSWRVSLAWINDYLARKEHALAVQLAADARKQHPDNIVLGLKYAEALVRAGQHVQALAFLEKFKALPAEGTTAGRMLYREAAVRAALGALTRNNAREAIRYARKARLWPENLGAGRPYEVDERLEDYLLAVAAERSGQKAMADTHYRALADYQAAGGSAGDSKILLQVAALTGKGEGPQAGQLIAEARRLGPENRLLQWISRVQAFGNPGRLDLELEHHMPVDLREQLEKQDADFGMVRDVLKALP
jgi:tetratricopeptide (TPR) repeat protein